MKKVVILGCENSHADTFLRLMRQDERWKDTEVAGVYSDEPSAASALSKKYDLKILKQYGELAGKVDGVIVTARHGDSHYKFAEPYLESGAALFLDKPIAVSVSDAHLFARAFETYKTRVTGGSSCKFDSTVLKLKADAAGQKGDRTIGGFVRCPIIMSSVYGGYFFYAQHLVEIVSEIFGAYPKSVAAFEKQGNITVIFRYEEFDVTGLYAGNGSSYFAVRASVDGTDGGELVIDDVCFKRELEEYRKILWEGAQGVLYERLLAPVYVMNAIKRSLETGGEIIL